MLTRRNLFVDVGEMRRRLSILRLSILRLTNRWRARCLERGTAGSEERVEVLRALLWENQSLMASATRSALILRALCRLMTKIYNKVYK